MSAKRHLDAELNLIPFIDLLSVCICFLLLTAVWVQVGALEVKQAIGGQSVAETTKKASLWVNVSSKGDVSMELRDSRAASQFAKQRVQAVDGKVDLASVEALVAKVKTLEPAISTALIQPQAETMYEALVELMDQFKKSGIGDLGVVPL